MTEPETGPDDNEAAPTRGLHRMAAPQDFGSRVEETIHRRSAGRFFGRRFLGGRLPVEPLAIAALLAVAALVWWLRQGA